MGNLKEQLAAIRPSIPKATTVETSERIQPAVLSGSVSARQQKKVLQDPQMTSDILDKCLCRMPYFGRIDSYEVARGFGKVSSNGRRIFLHANEKFPATKGKITEDLNNRNIVFTIGTSERDGNERTVQWALVDSIPWPDGTAPHDQISLDAMRRDWLQKLNLRQLLTCIRAHWYKGSLKNSVPSADLSDRILAGTLWNTLKNSSPEEWRKEQVRESLQVGRYDFLDKWDWTSSRVPSSLLCDFTAAQLAVLGAPRHDWLGSIGTEYLPKCHEWACRSELSPSQAEKWRAALLRGFQGDSDVALALLQDPTWQPRSIESAWIQRLAAAKKLPLAELSKRLKQCPQESTLWLTCLPPEDQLEHLISESKSPENLAKILGDINNPELDRLALCRYAISVDIESDGERIWEIGIADVQGKRLLLSRSDPPEKLPGAIAELGGCLGSARLVIGHNIVHWDWPILSEHLSTQSSPVLWDTMLVEFVLEPWKASHALGGSHRADEDAAVAFKLFQSQLAQLDEPIGHKLLSNSIPDTAALTGLLCERLESVNWKPPTIPETLGKSADEWPEGMTLIAHPSWIERSNWVPDIGIVTVDEREPLAIEWLTIRETLIDELTRRGLDNNPFGMVLHHVQRKAMRYNISIRTSMLPPWLSERAGIKEAILASASPASHLQNAREIAKYPPRADWYKCPPSESLIFLDPPESVFIAEVTWCRASQLPSELFRPHGNISRSGCLHRFEVSQAPKIDLWIALDPAMHLLDKSSNCYRTISAIDSREIGARKIRTSTQLKCKPRLLTRAETTLYPGSQDQSGYWMGVISGLQTVVRNLPPGVVPVLLVGSTASQELIKLLKQCLCEISLGVPDAKHHSRKDQLLKASETQGACVVGTLESWPTLEALGMAAGVSLCPVIEALPIGDWFIASEGNTEEFENSEDPVPEADDDEPERDEPDEVNQDSLDDVVLTSNKSANIVSGAKISAITHDLVQKNIGLWLKQSGLDTTTHSCIVLDPRIPYRNREMRNALECLEWKEVGFSEEHYRLLDQHLEPLSIKREAAPSDYESMRAFLEKHWNSGRSRNDPSWNWISDFRAGTQKPALEAIRERASDVLVSLPTGEGKSVLFQVPALCKGLRTRRLSLVVSPLRALMRDQVQRLHDLNFHQSVDYLTADRPIHEIDDVYQGVLDHRIVLLYVAPERFRSKRFMEIIDRRFSSDGAFEYVVIDEAHCVSQWGYEFRPDYFYALNTICEKYRQQDSAEKSPLLLLSATVTAANRDHLANLISGTTHANDPRYLDFTAKPEEYFHPIREHIEIQPASVPGKINTKPKNDWPIGPRLEVITSLISEAKANKGETGQHSSLIVFVSRRDHAEELSFILRQKLAKTSAATTVDFFHAGLDSESREEVYQRFSSGKIDVLVATKAFGMGMDIPHIHWAVHLAPPTFLEDYLQEVGRIGRGKSERESAKLEKLTATLLYSPEDFEANRTFIQQNRIELRQIADLYGAICSHSKQAENGVLVTMMPDSGFSAFDTAGKQRTASTQVRKTLYWLERLERVEILAMMPGLLPVRLDFPQLTKIADTETGPLAEVAKLLQMLSQPQQASPTERSSASKVSAQQERSFLERIIDGISNFVGVLLGGAPSPVPVQASVPLKLSAPKTALAERDVDAIINLAQIWRDTSLAHIDDVLSTIALLEKRQALVVTRKIRFSRRSYSYAIPARIDDLFNTLKEIAKRLIRQLEQESECIIDFNILSQGLQPVVVNGDLIELKDAFERPLCYLLRSAGVRVRDQLRDESRVLVATLAKKQARKTDSRMDACITAAKALWKEFLPRLNHEEREIEISRLLITTSQHAGKQRYRESDLRRYLGLLAVMRLISVSESLLPMSYVLAVHRTGEVLDGTVHPDIWRELGKVNRLTELRGDALEIFVHLPTAARDSFIRGYFEQTTPEEMENFLTEQLHRIEDQDAGNFINEKLEQLQAKAVDSFLERYSKSQPEEPNQWRAISHPFDRNLLVNAGPGSGKTSVLIARLAHLIRFQHIRPEEILVLAFNRAVVFEIRSRIKDLFRKLGYGAYVRRLNVATFHGFAMRNLGRLANQTDNWINDRSTLLSQFANKLETDSVFRIAVSGSIRCLLVDEFQDVNDDIYRIIRGLSKQPNHAASVMVIGDDDQDILGWNRSAGTSSEPYFRALMNDYSLSASDILTLKVNFRSGKQIVTHTQDVLNSFFEQHNAKDRRIKKGRLRPASKAGSDTVKAIDFPTGNFDDALALVRIALKTIETEPYQSVAILCRTNHEVARAYHNLRQACPELTVQNSVNYPVARLRHIGIWLDLVKSDLAANGDQPLTRDIFERVWNTYLTSDIPEVRNPRTDDLSPLQLWDLCEREASYPFLSHLIEFVESLDSEDVVRLLGRQDESRHPPVISTIHKVKGLEFDQVFLLPSLSSFPFNGSLAARLFDSAAEEARLQYVALTRAKKSITYFVGERERSWHRGNSFTGNIGTGKILEGSPKEVGISWAWEQRDWNPNPEQTLSYIQNTVRVGDSILVAGPSGKSLFHCHANQPRRQVGYISKNTGERGAKSELQVSAVLRCMYDGKTFFGGATVQSVRDKGWGLVVLAEGVLR